VAPAPPGELDARALHRSREHAACDGRTPLKTAFRYHVFEYFWPEFDPNYTWFAQGTRTGQSQLFLTPGLLPGRFPIHDRIGVAFGGGYQAAVTRHPSYNNAVILSARLGF
jgi:hypothetical protein